MSQARVRLALAKLSTRPPAEWAARLAAEFPDDPVMRRQALIWLHADQHAVHSEEAPPSLAADSQQRYELAVRLDSGATATVWQAFDRKLGRNVAIKVFHDQGASEAIEQVIAEAQAASDLISDHVVRVLDVHDDEAQPYIVMELVGEHDPERGEIVLGMAASSCPPRDSDEVARWVMQVARGVHDAHLRNVFHRDLKPQNVLITPISRRARVADFGLAVSGSSERVGEPAMTLIKRGPAGPVSVRGTPEYMAPEQAQGLPLSLDPKVAADRARLVAVDVWGLGAIAYDLLAGAPPWRGSDELAAWEAAASGEPAPRLERVPRRLRRIIEKAMAIDPAARYGTAVQVANELEAYLARRPTSQDRSRLVRMALWCRRNPQLALGALITVAFAALAVMTHITVGRVRTERNVLRDEVTAATAEQERLSARIGEARTELEATQDKLISARKNLLELERTIGEDRASYEALVSAKEQALRDANAATRHLVEQLEAAKRDRSEAERARATYEQLSAETRREADRAAKERDQIRKARDAARASRDAMQRERDALQNERDALVQARDAAISERERLEAKLRAAEERQARGAAK